MSATLSNTSGYSLTHSALRGNPTSQHQQVAPSTDRHATPVIARLLDVGRALRNYRGRNRHLVAWPLIGRLGWPEHEQLVSVMDALNTGKHRRRGWGGVLQGCRKRGYQANEAVEGRTTNA